MLLAYLVVLVDVARKEGDTFDEPMYLLAARSYWSTFDFSFNREHPPLLKLLIGLPLALAGTRIPPDYHVGVAAPIQFLYELNPSADQILFLGRLPMIALALLLALYVYRYAARFASERAGLLALLAFVSMPAVTGNAPLAALDVGAAAFGFIALYSLARLREQSGARQTIIAGVTLGLAELAKLTSLLLVPVYTLLLVIDAIRERSLRPIGSLAAVGGIALTTMFLGYGCEMRKLDSVRDHPRFQSKDPPRKVFNDPLLRRGAESFGDRPVPMLSYWKGFDHLKSRADEKAFPNYFRGEVKRGEGAPSFYAVSMAVKTPVGVLVLLAFALVVLPALPRRPKLEGPLLLYPAIVFAYFSFAPNQVGIRYILPVLPAAAVLIGRLADLDVSRRRAVVAAGTVVAFFILPAGLLLAFPEAGGLTRDKWLTALGVGTFGLVLLVTCAAAGWTRSRREVWGGIVAVMALAGTVEAYARHPHHLMFYNLFAGGPDHGFWITSLGDDWGQGTKPLAAAQRQHGWPTLHYAYYGSGKPEASGLDFRYWGGRPIDGLVAIPTAKLTREGEKFQFLKNFEPIGRVDSILLYEVKKPKPRRPP